MQHDHNYGGPGQPKDEGDKFTTEAFEPLNQTKLPTPEVEPEAKQAMDEWGGVKGAQKVSSLTSSRADVDAP